VPTTFDSESARKVIATERANVSVEPFGGKLESPKYEFGELTANTKMTYLELCMYLEERGVSEETIAMVMKRRITGKQLSHLCKHEQCEQLLEDNLHISDPLTRALIQCEFSGDHSETIVAQSPTTTTSTVNRLMPRLLKPEDIPRAPNRVSGSRAPLYQEWTMHSKRVALQFEIFDSEYAKLTSVAFLQPAKMLQERVSSTFALNANQTILDKVLCAGMALDKSGWLKNIVDDTEKYSWLGNSSGLMLVARAASMVVKRTDGRMLSLDNEGSSRPPCDDPLKLYDDLTWWKKHFEECEEAEMSYSETSRMAKIGKCIRSASASLW